jgi:hypothetical protein
MYEQSNDAILLVVSTSILFCISLCAQLFFLAHHTSAMYCSPVLRQILCAVTFYTDTNPELFPYVRPTIFQVLT